MPSLYPTSSAATANLSAYVRDGGTLVVSYFSGIIDETDAVHPSGYPGALRDLLGLAVEEFLPLRTGSAVRLDGDLTADVWTERFALAGPSRCDDIWTARPPAAPPSPGTASAQAPPGMYPPV
ncbi:hypothetical protein E1182_08355 [Micromonospora sp. KC721]|nr:hypothetical protein E1182_08355 [Micromonospora sp. KC721]